MIPLVVASERGRAQTNVVATHRWGCRTALSYGNCERKHLERCIIEGDNPVCEKTLLGSSIQSRARHEKSCLKQGRPLSNPKYYYYTDSAQVP